MSSSDIEDSGERHPLSYKRVLGSASLNADSVSQLLRDITSNEEGFRAALTEQSRRGGLTITIPTDCHKHIESNNNQCSAGQPTHAEPCGNNEYVTSGTSSVAMYSGNNESESTLKGVPAAPGASHFILSPGTLTATKKEEDSEVAVTHSLLEHESEDDKDDEIVSPIQTIFKHPLIHTQQQTHIAATPLILDKSALSDMSGPATTPPIFRRLGSRRPPPSTPPESVSHDRLSMPTLPTLHLTSTPALIERYRTERRLNPIAFDHHTQTIKHDLTTAKLNRGGTSTLLPNEYTAELASRLDATAIEGYTTIRQHEHPTEHDSDSSSCSTPLTTHHSTSASTTTHHIYPTVPINPDPTHAIQPPNNENTPLALHAPPVPGPKMYESATLKTARRVTVCPMGERKRRVVETWYKTVNVVEYAIDGNGGRQGEEDGDE